MSNKIIHALLNATQSYAEANVLLSEYPENKPALDYMRLALDICYEVYDSNPDIVDICHSLYINNSTTAIGKKVEMFTACADYTNSKVQETKVLTAVDPLKMDNAIKSISTEFLLLDRVSFDSERLIEPIWSILNDLI